MTDPTNGSPERLIVADPLRAMLEKVVEALERAEASLTAVGVHSVQHEMGMDARQVALELRALLTRIRTLASEDEGDRPMKRRHEGRWVMAESLPAPRPHESISPSNYPLPAGAVVEVGGDGFLPGTLKVRLSPHHSWRDVWEHTVRPVEQEELGL